MNLQYVQGHVMEWGHLTVSIIDSFDNSFLLWMCGYKVNKNKMNCKLMLTYDTPAHWQTGSRNLTGKKTLPTIWGTYMKLVTKYQISTINSCWEKCDEKWAYMFNVSDIWSQASYRYTILWVVFLDPSDSYFLFADFVDFYTHWTYMLIFRRIFLSNYWW
jgi:hypothetical protein